MLVPDENPMYDVSNDSIDGFTKSRQYAITWANNDTT